jgi:hypothetical protein
MIDPFFCTKCGQRAPNIINNYSQDTTDNSHITTDINNKK